MKLHVIATSYKRYGELKVFVQSWINQTKDNWHLTVIHDGEDETFNTIMEQFERDKPNHINHFCTQTRYNDYGHTLRDMGIQQAEGDYILLTNADNYFIPKAVEYLNIAASKKSDVILFDMVHAHEHPGDTKNLAYTSFITEYRRWRIDVSSAIVKTELAKKVGFRDKGFDGDATYFEDIKEVAYNKNLNIFKIPRILFVHN